jgi:hypothetical protein
VWDRLLVVVLPIRGDPAPGNLLRRPGLALALATLRVLLALCNIPQCAQQVVPDVRSGNHAAVIGAPIQLHRSIGGGLQRAGHHLNAHMPLFRTWTVLLVLHLSQVSPSPEARGLALNSFTTPVHHERPGCARNSWTPIDHIKAP